MSPMYSPMEIARIVYISSVGKHNCVVFWAACDVDTSSDAVAVMLLGRARFRDMTRVDVAIAKLGPRFSDGRWWELETRVVGRTKGEWR